MTAIGTYLVGAGATSAAAYTAGLAATSLAATAVAGGVSAYGQYKQGQTAKEVGHNNQVMAEYAAQDAQRKGEENAIAVQRRGDAIKGQQRARLGASGIDLGAGTAGELQDQVDFFSAGDKDMARFNAARDAWSMRARGAQSAAEGEAGARQGNLAAFGTALTTAGAVAGKWYGPKSGYGYGARGNSFFGTPEY